MRIALTGASGFIGSFTALAAHEAGHEVTGGVRSTSRRDHLEGVVDRLVEGSLEDRAIHARLLDGADALVHNAFNWEVLREKDLAGHLDINLAASIELLEAAAEAGIPVVLVSSVSVHHHMLEQWNGRIDDAHPTRPGSLYGASKAAIEAHLWALHADKNLRFTIIRPAAVYGVDPRIERSIGWPLLDCLERGETWDRRGGGKFVHVDDVAASIVRSLERDAAAGAIYHLADCYARWSDWAAMAADVLGLDVVTSESDAAAPKNAFTRDLIRADLDIALDRGHDGIRAHLDNLIRMRKKEELVP